MIYRCHQLCPAVSVRAEGSWCAEACLSTVGVFPNSWRHSSRHNSWPHFQTPYTLTKTTKHWQSKNNGVNGNISASGEDCSTQYSWLNLYTFKTHRQLIIPNKRMHVTHLSLLSPPLGLFGNQSAYFCPLCYRYTRDIPWVQRDSTNVWLDTLKHDEYFAWIQREL